MICVGENLINTKLISSVISNKQIIYSQSKDVSARCTYIANPRLCKLYQLLFALNQLLQMNLIN